MPELTTEVLAVLTAYLGKDGVSKLLGPTADYLGRELSVFTQTRIENVGKIFSNAKKKLGKKLERPGRVHPKVLKTIINDGSYADDDITAEYFGGVLASSRTGVNRDDRGNRFARMIDNLSAYQIRTHYLVYSTISELFSDTANSFDVPENRKKLTLFMPFKGFFRAMEFTPQERGNQQILSHIFHGLETDGLIGQAWNFGARQFLEKRVGTLPSDGIVCTPTALGAELLLWAFGHGDKKLDFLLTSDFSSEITGIPKAVPDATSTKDTTRRVG